MNQAKRVIGARATKHDQPIALSTSKRQFKKITNDFSRLWMQRQIHSTCERISRGRFRSVRLLEKCSKRVPLVLGLSADVKNWRTKILTRRDLSNSPLLSRPGGQRFSPILFPSSFSFLRYQYHQHSYKDTRTERKERLYGGVLGFKIIGVKLG